MIGDSVNTSVKQSTNFQPVEVPTTQSTNATVGVADKYEATQRANNAVPTQTPVDPPTLTTRLRPGILRAVARINAIFVDPETRRPTKVGRAVVIISTAVAAGAAAVAFVHGGPLFMGVGLAIAAGTGALWLAGWGAGAIRRSYLERKRAAHEAATASQPTEKSPQSQPVAAELPKQVLPEMSQHGLDLFADEAVGLNDEDELARPTKRAKLGPAPEAKVLPPGPPAQKIKVD